MTTQAAPSEPETPVMLSAKVDAELAAELRALAERSERSVSAVIRIALREYLTRAADAPV